MPRNAYECLFILDSNRYARDMAAVAASITAMVEDVNGEVLAGRMWTEQRLAYPIGGHRKGTYWLTYFRMESTRLTEFNRACQLNDYVLRHLVLKVDPRLIDVLVAHAAGKATAPKSDEVADDGDSSSESEAEETAEVTAGS